MTRRWRVVLLEALVLVLLPLGVVVAQVVTGSNVSLPVLVTQGGTGLTGGTSGGVPYYASASTMASSAALAANQLILGGGAGAAPATLGSLGTTTTVLHGNAAGAPSFGAVALTTDVTGTLPAANGGTGQSSYAVGDLLYASGATALSRLADVGLNAVLVSGGVGAAPVWSATPTVGAITAGTFTTSTNCASSASPAACGSAAGGSAVIAAAATSVVVNTTAVTATSVILVTQDQSLGTKLSVTCNTQSDLVVGTPEVSARVAGTSFTVIVPVAPTTNPVCFNYFVVG